MSELRAPVFAKYAKVFPETIPARPMVVSISPALCDLIADVCERYGAKDLAALAPPPFEDGFIEWAARPGLEFPFCARVFSDKLGAPEMWLFAADAKGLKTVGAFALNDNRVVADRAHSNFGAIAGTIPGWADATDGNGDLLCDGQAEVWDKWWIATCAALATPGVRCSDEQRREKRLQTVKGRQAPLVTYRCVDVDIDRLAGIPEVSSGCGDDGRVGVALHHVRGHLRLTEKKGLVPVRPHWRGSAENGIRFKDQNAMRNEEMH